MSWNKPSSVPQPPPKKSAPPSLKRGLLAGLLVVALGALGLYLFSSGEADSRPLQKTDRGRIKEVTPAAAPKPAATQVVEKVVKADSYAKYGTPISCKTNAALGKICTVYRDAEGKTHKVYRPSRPPIFKHGTDQLLAMALCGSENRSMPPLPISGNLDKRFLDSLKDPIEIGPDDSPQIAARKQTVIDARARMKELMDAGGSFSEILADHQKLFNENVKIRSDAARELQRIVDDGDTEGTRQYLLKVNLALQQMGIKELDEPRTTEERRAERAQMRAERAAAKEQAK